MTAASFPVRFWEPLYIYPNPITPWDTVIAGAPAVQYIVANPASGPGSSADPYYTTAITAALAANITVLGYVDTNSGAVSTTTVSTNVGLWKSLYGIDSIFFDRASPSSTEESYYTTVCGYVTGTTVLNHGSVPDSGYAAIGDVLMVFENTYSAWPAFSPPSWFADYPPSKFGLAVYGVTGAAAMREVVSQAAAYGVGTICVTDEADDFFSSLPTYLTAELAWMATGGFPAAPLNATAELQLAGTWTDITPYALQREGTSPPISITRGRADESAQVNAATAQFQLNNRDGRFTVKNATGPFYGELGRNTPIRISVPAESVYLRLEEDQDSAAACPDATALHITGDIDVRIDVDITNYAEAVLCSKWNATAADGYAWLLVISGTGQLIWFWSDNGTDVNSATSTLPVPLGRECFRVTMAASTGTVTFYTGAAGGADGSTWTQLGSQTVHGSTSIYAATAQLAAGNYDPAATAVAGACGSYYELEVRSGIAGTVEAHPVFSAQPPGVTSFTDVQGNTWTLSGTAELSGRSFRFHGELSSLPVAWDTTGADVWVPVAAGGLLRRLGQGDAPLDSAMKRALLSQSGTLAPAAYWPMEDLQGSTAIGSAIGGPLMSVIGGTGDGSITSSGPAFAADNSFLCSMALPTLNGAQFYGQVPRYTSSGSIIHRFLLKAGSTAPASITPLVRLITTGTAMSIEVRADTSWGLTFLGGNASGTVFTTGALNFGTDYSATNIEGIQLWVSMELKPGGGSTVDYAIVVLRPGDSTGYQATGTFTGTIGNVTAVYFNTGQQLTDTVVGHSSLQSAWESLFNLAQPLNAWQGEEAGNRFTRLCGENGITGRVYGPPDTTVTMGAQAPDTLTDLLQEIETADHGQLFEPRQVLALGYRPQAALLSQDPVVTIDYSAAELGGADLQPTYDDQFTRNDMTAQRASGNVSGASYRYQLDDGTDMSISPPPGGVGDYADQVSVNVEADTQLPDQAGWLVHVGTVDEARWPVLPINMARAAVAGIFWDVLAADIGDYIQVINPPAQLPPDPIRQLVWGLREDLGGFFFQIEWNGVPESPYEVEILNDAVYGACDTDGSTLASSATSTATSLSVATTNATSPLWTTNSADCPFDIAVGGERITVTAVSGSSSPQTFTVTRSVNGVVKAQASGADVRLWFPPILAMV